jgi:Family of unknown function (DUF5309)
MLFDLISLDDYKEKPLLAMIPKEQKLTNMRMDWQADLYAVPNTKGVADGVPVKNVENAAENRAKISAYAQKFRRTAGVGTTAEEISKVAGASEGEMARSIDKKLEEIGRDIEVALGSDNDTQLEESEEKPYLLRGLGSWYKATAQATLPVPAGFLTPAASINTTATAGLSEEGDIKPLLESVFTQYGKSQDLPLVCGTALKRAFTRMTQIASGTQNTQISIRTFNQNIEEKKITSNVLIYEGDFNNVQLHTSLLLANTGTRVPSDAGKARGYVVPMDRVALSWGWQPRVTPLAQDGSGPRAMIEAVLGLVHKNPLIGGKFAAAN